MGTITVTHLGKAYKQYSNRWSRLAEWLLPGTKPRHHLHWVLQDINFTVTPGEAIGIIGINGAGKSTLLKIITGTTQPTTGGVHITGRVAALLELGMGFHPDFTGRQNVFMAGQLLGYSVEEIARLMPDIEAFADIGDYIHQPVRVYSSGMQVRLAFAVATASRPDILIVDEALAVGDIFFQQKCFDRIREYRREGTTLLFVSHALDSVYSLCDRALLIENGHLLMNDRPKAVIDLYNAKIIQKANPSGGTLKVSGPDNKEINTATVDIDPEESITDHVEKGGLDVGSYYSGSVRIRSVRLLVRGSEADCFISEESVTIKIIVEFLKYFDDPHVGFQIKNTRGEPVFMTTTHGMRIIIGEAQEKTAVEVCFSFEAKFAEGQYTITAGVANGGGADGQFNESLARTQNVLAFTVLRNIESIRWAGVFNISPKCNVKVLNG